MAFRSWWVEHQIDGWHLDKDLVSPFCMVYSKETSIYVPRWLNNMVIDCRAARGVLPIGVRSSGAKYSFRCRVGNGERVCVGGFLSPEEAFAGWIAEKIKYATSRKVEMDSIDKRIYEGVIKIIKNCK